VVPQLCVWRGLGARPPVAGHASQRPGHDAKGARAQPLPAETKSFLSPARPPYACSRVLSHPNVLQTFDFCAAVVTDADCDAIQRSSTSEQQQPGARRVADGSCSSDASAASPFNNLVCPVELLRADSFELPAGMTPGDSCMLRCVRACLRLPPHPSSQSPNMLAAGAADG
jgi:hypothetical protein